MFTILILLSFIHSGTFSIVAMDPQTNEWGIAVASKVLDVGYIVPWAQAEIGAVATQAYANPYIGPWALEALAQGKSAEEVLKIVIERDTLAEERQIGIVDMNGNAAAYTGENCLDFADHKTAPYVCVQGNIITGPEVLENMLEIFQKSQGPLAERLLLALEAGEKAGGDKRGKQSSAIIVVRRRGGYQGVDDRLVDLKVVDNTEPVKELRRQYELWQYSFLAPAYIRLADEESKEIFLDRAYSLLLKALEKNLESPEVYNNLAWEFALRKMYPEKTIEAANKAHKLDPDDANIMDTLAEAYYAAGDYKTAISWEKKALEIDPKNEFYKKQLKKFEEALKSMNN
jgi:uncharacterized Ntn-hydrolase superfamily protein